MGRAQGGWQPSLSARRAWIEIISGLHPLIASLTSLSARRAWIEISIDDLEPSSTRKSLSARRAWIEIFIGPLIFKVQPSLSARRAWIEIAMTGQISVSTVVALRKESVDRN